MSVISAGTGDTKYNIYISKQLSKNLLNKYVKRNNKLLIVTDTGIPNEHIKNLKSIINSRNCHIFKLPKGEKSKSLNSYKKIIDELIKLKFDRSDSLLAFGGGVVGDITGFVASTYLRGINYIQIPTTLLAQVDSSVGGKTAINIPQGKNLVGAFNNPCCVMISTNYLKTLPEKEFHSGLGEVIKYALIGNSKLKNIIEKNPKQIKDKKETFLKIIIEESIKTKSKIVTKDEKEAGVRAILNFGHTFGHAIEAYNNYKNISHGAAITLGIIIASKLSFYEGYIKDYQLDNVINIVDSLGLNSDHSKYNYSKLKKFMANDKKVSKGKLNFIMIDKNFNGFKTSNYDIKNVKKALN